MDKRIKTVILSLALLPCASFAQHDGLTDVSASPHAIMANTPLGSTRWTGGFWGERFGVWSGTSIWDMWRTWDDPSVSHGFRNFEIAAGDAEGEHAGPPFHDGDMYKWLEACAAVYAVTKDKKLDKLMDKFITKVAKAQRPDGYIHTPVNTSERQLKKSGQSADTTVIGIEIGKEQGTAFASRLNFETYNLGHLMMAGIVHKRATGKDNLFNCSKKAADFLYNFYKNNRNELARNAICPSHYMGAFEMYRETGDKRYLELGEGLIAIRDSVKNGEDHNQDRVPFRQQYEAVGHAVRANYLYAGVADEYAETGEAQLMKNLSSIWDDIADHKIYITGGCGALYDGVSPDGTTYDQPSIQQIHQAYGRKFQLPNEASHNETCAQVGELLYSWRLFETTGKAKYADMVEHELLNGIMPGISLDGTKYFYTQALRKTASFPYVLRWPKSRQRYISCFCCPPNTLRTLAEAQEYAYSVGKDGTLYVNLYGDNKLKTKDIDVEMLSDYPLDGHITLKINRLNGIKNVSFRIPSWADDVTMTVNGDSVNISDCVKPGYAELTHPWKKGDVVTLDLPMRPRLIEANPLVEESKNQVAVMRGPLVYCLEGLDITAGRSNGLRPDAAINDTLPSVSNISIPADIHFTEHRDTLDGNTFVALEADVPAASEPSWGKNELYREVRPTEQKVHIRLIPYYAWGNRGETDMTVFMNLRR